MCYSQFCTLMKLRMCAMVTFSLHSNIESTGLLTDMTKNSPPRLLLRLRFGGQLSRPLEWGEPSDIIIIERFVTMSMISVKILPLSTTFQSVIPIHLEHILSL